MSKNAELILNIITLVIFIIILIVNIYIMTVNINLSFITRSNLLDKH